MSKSNSKSSLWTVPAKLSPFYKWLIVIILVSVYAISFPWMFEQLGDFSRLFMFIFILPVVLFWGLKGGVAIALLSTLAMIVFYQVSGEKFSGGAIGPLFLFVIVIIIGRMRDLSLQLEAELRKKNQAEIELIEYQANLEKMIKERTIELSKSNSDLQQKISERKIAANALKESEIRFRTVAEKSPNMIFINQKGRVVYINDRCMEMMGHDRDEFLSPEFNFLSLMVSESKRRAELSFSNHIKNIEAQPLEYTLIKKDGSLIDTVINTKLIEYKGERAILGIVTDITRQKEYERALANAKNQWEETFDAVWDWVSIIDRNNKIIRSNKACKNFINLPADQVIGKSCYQLVHGMECPISDCPLKRAIKSKQRENMEIQLEDGRWIMISVYPIKSENSNELYVHIVRDITEIKKKEIESLNAHKAEAFSILSGGIAHDYNNLLAIIWGNISLLREDITDALQQEFIEEAEKACEQARTLTHQFITLSKGVMFKKSAHPIEDILRAVTEKVENKNKVTISLNIQDRIPRIEVDPNYLMIAFENIIQNGLDAMTGRGQLEINAGIESLVHEEQKRPECLKISFKDTGKGILKSDVSLIFDPYFTTKEMGTQKGSGLGLAVSESIIKKHGGNIRIESMIDQGTTVIVSIPLSDFQLNDLSESNI